MPSLAQSLAEKTPYVPAGQAFVRDSELPGFALRVTKTSKSFVFERRIHGRMRRVTLGRLGMLTADQAREEARRMAADISPGRVPERLRKRRTLRHFADLSLVHYAPWKSCAPNG